MLTRRELLKGGAVWLAGLAWGRIAWSSGAGDVVEIYMRSSPDGARVAFDPPGLLVRPGQRIRWVNDGNSVHTVTAYHPANDRHPLRIPSAAAPWDSGYLLNKGDSFEMKLDVEGVYDYYCIPHEAAGMVGRIIVSASGKPDADIFREYPEIPAEEGWKRVPQQALRNFPPIPAIFKKGRIGGFERG